MTAPLIELRHVTKTFGATRALDDVSFDVREGEVHVLAGENGAGKSTLIRVLSGVITDHDGEMLLAGVPVRLRDARDAARRGIATIHQELSLVGSMTVAENLSLSPRAASRPPGLFSWVRAEDEARAAKEILATMDLDVDPAALVETLPLATRQLIEIARALAQRARLLILDEPTSALSEPEADHLLTRVERLAAEGCGVVYISHRMEENERLARGDPQSGGAPDQRASPRTGREGSPAHTAHRITVLRDGRVVASRPAKDLPRAELVALMMGSGARKQADPDQHPPSPLALSKKGNLAPRTGSDDVQGPPLVRSEELGPSPRTGSNDIQGPPLVRSEELGPSPRTGSDDIQGPPLVRSHELATSAGTTPMLRVEGLCLRVSGAAALRSVSFDVNAGEILGLAGLRGSGASEILAALFGVHGRAATAEVRLSGAPYFIENPQKSIEQGLLCLANDRKKTVFADLDITENITLSSLPAVSEYGVLSIARETEIARALTSRLRVAAASLRSPAGSLSGGNQQKVALLRCLAAGPKAVLFDEPTRGVDIGAKTEIHRTLRALAAEGKAIVLVTSELPELLSLCDRILVLRRGRVAETLQKADFSRDRLRLSLDG